MRTRRRFSAVASVIIGSLALTLVIGLVMPCVALGAVTRYEQDDPSVSYSPVWNADVPGVGLSGGTYAWTNAGGTASFSFSGTGVDWIGRRQRWFGFAEVSVDGSAWAAVDLYSPVDVISGVVWSTTGLANGPHVLRIRWTGEQDPASTEGVYYGGVPPYNPAALVGIDAFDVYTPDTVPIGVQIGREYGDSVLDTYIIAKYSTGSLVRSTADFVGSTARDEERTLVSFPLSKLAGVSVTDATLSLTKTIGGTSGFPLRAYRLRRPVTTTAAWGQWQTGAAWGAAGAKSAATDFYDDIYAVSTDGNFDVGPLLQAAIASGEDSLDLIIVDPAPVAGRYIGFYSSDCVYSPWWPSLYVDGTVPAP